MAGEFTLQETYRSMRHSIVREAVLAAHTPGARGLALARISGVTYNSTTPANGFWDDDGTWIEGGIGISAGELSA